MDSILQDVLFVIENWLTELDQKEVELERITNLQKEIEKRYLQVQFEGDGVIDSNRLQFVSQCWSKILELLTGLPDTKFDLVFKILELFQSDEISITLAFDMIIKLM